MDKEIRCKDINCTAKHYREEIKPDGSRVALVRIKSHGKWHIAEIPITIKLLEKAKP